MYVQSPKERCIFGFDSPFRFLKDGCWRKGSEGLVLLSTEDEALFEFKSEHDLSLQMARFAQVRIVVVVKEFDGKNDTFREKLMLLTSKKHIIVARNLDKSFDRYAVPEDHDWYTTLILALSAKENPVISLSAFPFNKPAKCFEIRYDTESKTFDIPLELSLDSYTSAPTDDFKNDDVTALQISAKESEVKQHDSQQFAVITLICRANFLQISSF